MFPEGPDGGSIFVDLLVGSGQPVGHSFHKRGFAFGHILTSKGSFAKLNCETLANLHFAPDIKTSVLELISHPFFEVMVLKINCLKMIIHAIVATICIQRYASFRNKIDKRRT